MATRNVVYLCSNPLSKTRFKRSGQNNNSRSLLSVDTLNWLQRVLGEIPGRVQGVIDIGAAMNSGVAKIIGIAVLILRPDLTACDRDCGPENRLWFELEGPSWQRACLQCTIVTSLQDPLIAVAKGAQRETQWPVFALSTACAQSAFDQLSENLIRETAVNRDIAFAFNVPPILAELVVHGKLRTVQVSLSLRTGRGNPYATAFTHLQTIAQPPDDQRRHMILPLQSEIFQNLETFLDICQSSVPAQLREDARDDFLDEADTFIRWARRCATVLAKHTIMDHRMERPKIRTFKNMRINAEAVTGRYTSWCALHAVFIARKLHQSSDISIVLELALHMAYPRPLAKQLVELIKDCPTPSPSTLSRHRLAVDVAYMLLRREWHQALLPMDKVAAIFLLSDASPQGGRDWQLAECQTIVADFF